MNGLRRDESGAGAAASLVRSLTACDWTSAATASSWTRAKGRRSTGGEERTRETPAADASHAISRVAPPRYAAARAGGIDCRFQDPRREARTRGRNVGSSYYLMWTVEKHSAAHARRMRCSGSFVRSAVSRRRMRCAVVVRFAVPPVSSSGPSTYTTFPQSPSYRRAISRPDSREKPSPRLVGAR